MNSERIASWLQIVGNFGVIVGLVFVGYQLYQDRELKRVELLDQGWVLNIERSRDLMGETMGETLAKSALQPENLTDTERYLLNLYFDSVIAHRRRNLMLEASGMRDSEIRQTGLPAAFETEVGKKYLQRLLANPGPESQSWSFPLELRKVWESRINSESYTQGLERHISQLRADDAGSESASTPKRNKE